MVTVEKMLKGLVALSIRDVIKDSWHKSFLTNVKQHVNQGKALSTNQAQVVLKASTKFVYELSRELGVPKDDLKSCIEHPTYENSPYQSISILREVRYIGMNKLAFRFKLDNTVVHEIKALSSGYDPVHSRPFWNEQYRIWIVTVTPNNLDKVFKIIQNHKFGFDEPVLEYMTLCTNSKEGRSTFQGIEGEDLHVANVVNNPLLAYMVEHVMKGEPV